MPARLGDQVKIWTMLDWESFKTKILNKWWEDFDNQACSFLLGFSGAGDGGCFPRWDVFSGSLINHLNHTTFSTLQLQAAGNNKVLVCGSALHPFDLTSAEWHAAGVRWRANVARVCTEKAEQQSTATKQQFRHRKIIVLHVRDKRCLGGATQLISWMNVQTIYKEQEPRNSLLPFYCNCITLTYYLVTEQ